MATLITKNSSTASAVPAAGDLVKGELAVNVTDKKVYTKDNSAAVVKLVGSLGNQEANAVAITGGAINGTTIGATTPSTGAFTTASASSGFTGNLTGNVTGNVSGTAANVTGVVAIANGGTGLSSLGTGVQSALGQAVTGSGSFVLSTSPSLTTPNLGTPSAAVLTNATGLPLTTGVTGTLGVANGGTGITAFGTGVATALGQNVTGSGGIVLVTSPSLTTPNLGTPSAATLTNATGLPISTGVSGLGTNVATALAVNVGTAGAFVVNGGALGTPSGGTLTNCTGYPTSALSGSINLATQVTGTLATTNGGTGLTSFTANGVVYASSTSALTTGSALTFDGTYFTVGASATTGDYKAFIQKAGGELLGLNASSGTLTRIAFGNATASFGSTQIIANAADLAFITNSAEQMRLTSTGLGIGTSSVLSKLVVSNAGAQGLEVQPGALTLLFAYNRSTSAYSALDIAGEYLRFSTSVGAERMRLDASGNLGIGTSSPAAKLQVNQTLSSGTAISVVGSSANTVLTSDYASLFLQNTNTTNGNYNAIGFVNDQGGYSSAIYGVYTSHTSGAQSGELAFSTRSAGTFAERMRLDSSGNLGLGVTPSAWRSTTRALQIGSTSSFQNFDNGGTIAVSMGNNFYWNSADQAIYIQSKAASNYYQTGGQHVWQTAASGNAGDPISFTQAMTLDASGNLGVGTTSPSYRLDVSGNIIRFANGTYSGYMGAGSSLASGGASDFNIRSDAVLSFASGGGTERARITSGGELLLNTTSNSGGHRLVVSQTNASGVAAIHLPVDESTILGPTANTNITMGSNLYVRASSVLGFSTNNTERARITSGGDLLVGTTDSGSGATAAKQRIIGAASNNLYLGCTSAGGWRITSDALSDGGTFYHIKFSENGTERGSITSNGSSTTYATSSDYRLKENIQPMTGALAKVAALKPCTYKWKADGSNGEGFIAHELQAVVPQCVTGKKDAVDAEGKPVYQGIDTSFLVATLTAAIQEQQAIITDLRARVAQLEAK